MRLLKKQFDVSWKIEIFIVSLIWSLIMITHRVWLFSQAHSLLCLFIALSQIVSMFSSKARL